MTLFMIDARWILKDIRFFFFIFFWRNLMIKHIITFRTCWGDKYMYRIVKIAAQYYLFCRNCHLSDTVPEKNSVIWNLIVAAWFVNNKWHVKKCELLSFSTNGTNVLNCVNLFSNNRRFVKENLKQWKLEIAVCCGPKSKY